MRKLAVSLACALTLAAPAVARAGDVVMHVQEVPLGGRVLTAAAQPMHFNMLASHWLGSGVVAFRTHRLHGMWSGWREANADDGGSPPWHDGELVWTGGSDAVQFRVRGRVTRLRSYELWSRVTSATRAVATATQPAIVTRSSWAADEKIVRAKPLYAKTLKLAIIHHTVGTNTYSPAQSAAIVRGIELYHVKGNGWNDIGYNFLVDRYGTVYEGRGGGMTRNVIGAHAEGFNTGSVGVALIGNFSTATPPKAMQDALVKLLAWRLDEAHVDPLASVAYTSGGNLKYRAGKVVTLRTISGHRDTGPTECPGNGTYSLLNGFAKRVSLTGLPKLYGPTVAGTLGGPVRFQARLSKAIPWTVTVTNLAGKIVAQGSGKSSLVDWTWHSPQGKGSYAWVIAAPGALSAVGSIGGTAKPPPPPPPPPAAFTLTGLAATPAVVAPAADGTGATTTVSFTTGTAARITAQVLDASGTVVATPLDQQRPAGLNSFVFDATALQDGHYTLTVAGKPAHGSAASQTVAFTVDRTMTGLGISPPAFTPNGDGADDTATLSFTLSQPVAVHIEVQQAGLVAATLFDGTLGAGPHSLAWDGTDGAGNVLLAGAYTIVVTVTDALGAVSTPVAVTIA